MKRLTAKGFAVLMVVALIVSLAACGSKNDNDEAAAAPSAATPEATASSDASASQTEEASASTAESPSAEPSASASASHEAEHEVEHEAEHEAEASPSSSAKPSSSPTKPDKPASPSPSPSSSASAEASASPSASQDDDSDKAEEIVVEIKGFAFSPADITIKKGQTVTFVNRDKVRHNAAADDGSFETVLLGQDESATVTLDEVGEFGYYCMPHPNMRGKITVTED